MTAQEVLEAAFQKIVKNARANCPRCKADNQFERLGFWTLPEDTHRHSKVNPGFPHTCDATIDAAAEAMLAAAQEVQRQVRLYGPVDAAFKVEATIKRLLKGDTE